MLLTAPTEVQSLIVSYIPSCQDVRALLQTCSSGRAIGRTADAKMMWLARQRPPAEAMRNAAVQRDEGLMLSLCKLDGGALVQKQQDWKEALLIAIRAGMVEVVRQLAGMPGKDATHPGFMGMTALHVACLWGCAEVVQVLAAVPGMDVNAKDRQGFTPLMVAAKAGRTAAVEVLLANPDVDVAITVDAVGVPEPKSDFQLTVLHHAAIQGGSNAGIIEALLRHPQAASLRPCKKGHIYAIQKLLYRPQIPVFQALASPAGLACGLFDGLNDEDSPFTFALTTFTSKSYSYFFGGQDNFDKLGEIIKVLWASIPDRDPNIKVRTGPVLNHFCSSSEPERLQEFIDIMLATPGIDVNLLDNKGFTPMHATCFQDFKDKQLQVTRVKQLLAAGADVHAKNQDGKTPLDLCRANASNKELEELLEAKA